MRFWSGECEAAQFRVCVASETIRLGTDHLLLSIFKAVGEALAPALARIYETRTRGRDFAVG